VGGQVYQPPQGWLRGKNLDAGTFALRRTVRRGDQTFPTVITAAKMTAAQERLWRESLDYERSRARGTSQTARSAAALMRRRQTSTPGTVALLLIRSATAA
jgi:hypothetical protein